MEIQNENLCVGCKQDYRLQADFLCYDCLSKDMEENN